MMRPVLVMRNYDDINLVNDGVCPIAGRHSLIISDETELYHFNWDLAEEGADFTATRIHTCAPCNVTYIQTTTAPNVWIRITDEAIVNGDTRVFSQRVNG